MVKSIIDRRLDIPGADKLLDFVANDSPWLFGLEPSNLAEFIQPYGLALVEDVGNAHYQEHFLRSIGRTLTVTEGEGDAQAVVTGP